MRKPRISIICAVAEKNRAIGKNNKLLWDIPEDLQHFKKITLGHPVIMGQKTFESIGKPLPGRLNIVLTKDPQLKIKNCIVCHSINEAIKLANKDTKEIFFIGGGSIYTQAISLADRLYLTLVEGDYEADTYFPEYINFTKVISEQEEESNGYKYKYIVLEREDR